MWDNFVVFGINGFRDHVGVVVVIEDATPHYVGGSVYILDHQAAPTVSGLDLSLSAFAIEESEIS